LPHAIIIIDKHYLRYDDLMKKLATGWLRKW